MLGIELLCTSSRFADDEVAAPAADDPSPSSEPLWFLKGLDGAIIPVVAAADAPLSGCRAFELL
jgi:hypothetical protein